MEISLLVEKHKSGTIKSYIWHMFLFLRGAPPFNFLQTAAAVVEKNRTEKKMP